MSSSIPDRVAARHLLTSEISPRMAKADLRKAENWRVSGEVIARTRTLSGLSLKQFADAVGRDERQITRWEKADERPQIETVLAVTGLTPFVVIALAEVAGVSVEVETVVRVRRRVA